VAEFDLVRCNAALAELLRARLGVRGATLKTGLRRAGRLLPRPVRKAGQDLARAEALWANPKLRRRLDPARLAEAERLVRTHLETIDRADRRRGYWLGVAAPLAFNLLLLLAAAVAWLHWSGRV
jgi:hypothetical protein